MKATPAIPLFGDAYLADTRHLSLEEHGAYLQLLMIAWRIDGCCLPDDDTRLARMLGVPAAKWRKLKPVVMAFWELDGDQWKQRRLTKERNFVEAKRAKNVAAAESRWSAEVIENKEGEECERISERNAPPPPPPQEGIKGDATHHSPQPIQEAVDFYNENAVQADWPTIRLLTDSRRSALRSRLKREGLEGWKAAIVRARASPFLARDPPPNFFTFDWLVKASNFVKVTEGNYDRPRQSDPQTVRGSRPNPAFDMLRDAIADEQAERGDPPFGGGTRIALPAFRGS